MYAEYGTQKVVPQNLSLAGKRRYRHARTPCPEPQSGEVTWLRGRRKSPGVLLALHHAAVLLRCGDQGSAQLYQGSVYEACRSEKQPWYPKQEVLFRWLSHHRIARKIDHNLWTAGLSAPAFAMIPNRNRVMRIGALILLREKAASHARQARAVPEQGSFPTSPSSAEQTLIYLSPIELDMPVSGHAK